MAADESGDGGAETAEVPGEEATEGASRPFAGPGGPGYADPALVAGRPASSYVHIGALLVAGAADVGAFYQIVSRVLPETPGPLVYLIVMGFTGSVVYLAHVMGVLARNSRAKVRSTSAWAIPVCLAVLGVLGTVAFLVRLRVPAVGRRAPTTISAAGSSPGATPASNTEFYAALVFLALYVATVAVAAIGAYLTYNPRQESYLAAVRMYHKLSARTGVAHAALLVAEGREAGERANRDAAEKVLQAQTQKILAHREELKQRVRVLLLAAARDPAVTDAWMTGDASPYSYPQHGPMTNGSKET